VTGRLVEEGIVSEDDPAYAGVLRRAARLRDAGTVELALVVLALAFSHVALWGFGPWHGGTQAAAAAQPSVTRVWYGLFALPIVQLFTLRWLWRWLIWTALLIWLSRLRLRLEPGHPDGAGGLGELTQASLAFAPIACAFSVVLTGAWTGRILHEGARLADLGRPLAVFLVAMIALGFAPLLALTPPLVRARVQGTREWGRLFAEYARHFRERWIERRSETGSLDNPHIEPLANLTEVHRRVEAMRIVPFTGVAVLRFAGLTVLPLVPLLLLEVPLEELLRLVRGLLVGAHLTRGRNVGVFDP
jgi:hypothetical protein